MEELSELEEERRARQTAGKKAGAGTDDTMIPARPRGMASNEMCVHF